jgi:Regulator of G protein signaling domain
VRTVCTEIVRTYKHRYAGSYCISHHWLPQWMLVALMAARSLLKRVTAVFLPDSSLIHASSSAHIYLSAENVLSEESNNDIALTEKPSDDSLGELMRVFSDPTRLKVLRAMADEFHLGENVEFISTVLDYQNNAASQLVGTSSQVSVSLKAQAKQIFDEYIKAHSVNEVNVSSSTRTYVGSLLHGWNTHPPFLTEELAKMALENDVFKRSTLFERPLKEISTVLYQNIWNRFRTREATTAAAEDDNGLLNFKPDV